MVGRNLGGRPFRTHLYQGIARYQRPMAPGARVWCHALEQEASMTPVTATKTAEQTTEAAIRPFQVDVPEAELTDLRNRVRAARLPEKETVSDFSQGVPLDTVQKLARYWATEYDWRKVEARLKSVPNFITEIDGHDITVIHRSTQP